MCSRASATIDVFSTSFAQRAEPVCDSFRSSRAAPARSSAPEPQGSCPDNISNDTRPGLRARHARPLNGPLKEDALSRFRRRTTRMWLNSAKCGTTLPTLRGIPAAFGLVLNLFWSGFGMIRAGIGDNWMGIALLQLGIEQNRARGRPSDGRLGVGRLFLFQETRRRD